MPSVSRLFYLVVWFDLPSSRWCLWVKASLPSATQKRSRSTCPDGHYRGELIVRWAEVSTDSGKGAAAASYPWQARKWSSSHHTPLPGFVTFSSDRHCPLSPDHNVTEVPGKCLSYSYNWNDFRAEYLFSHPKRVECVAGTHSTAGILLSHVGREKWAPCFMEAQAGSKFTEQENLQIWDVCIIFC